MIFIFQNPMPKMSLFCFLIDEVRSTSLLETPDSNSCFAVKVPEVDNLGSSVC